LRLVTDLWTDDGWLYLAIVLDLFNREVIGWSIKPRMTTDFVLDALSVAGFRRGPDPGVLLHSARGSPYASQAYQARLATDGLRASMSCQGNCWNNAPTKSVFNRLKNERVHGVRYATRSEAASDLFQ
jgi:putative transposase